MKKIIHLSDLHFGTERPGIVEPLVTDIQKINPDIIVVSGDLTQRALHRQFKAARQFFQAISKDNNLLTVPGNHDISLHNLVERFFYPYSKYKKYITSDLYTQLLSENIAILGINSVTPYKRMDGYVTDNQLEYVTEFFHKHNNYAVKILVMHHNLIRSQRHKIINDSEKIITNFSKCNINLILSGHIHHAYIEQLKRDYFSHNMYVVTAGTPISTRTIEPNSYNIIDIGDAEFKMTVREFKNGEFITATETSFKL